MSRKKRRIPKWLSRREKDGAWMCMMAILVLSIAAIGLMALLNRLPSGGRSSHATAKDIWYLRNAEMQIAAPAADESN